MAVATPPAPQAAAPATAVRPTRRARGGRALLLALLLAAAYAPFASGSIDVIDEARLQVWFALVALVASAVWLAEGSLRLPGPRAAWLAVALLFAFGAWCGVSLFWSVAPDLTWAGANRALAYGLVVALGLAAASAAPRAVETIAVGWLLIAVAVALYALGGKVIPGVNVPGVFDLNHTSLFSRLRGPLGYWNALALVCVLAIPIALRIAAGVGRTKRMRLAALAALFLLVIVVGLTYSRGGLLATVIAVIVVTAYAGPRLRGLATIGLALGAALIPLAVAFTQPALTANGADLGQRITAGRTLGITLVAALVALLLVGRVLLGLESRVNWTPARSRRTWRLLRGVGIVAALVVFTAMAASDRGLTGTISHQVDAFTTVKKDVTNDPSRLLSTNSGNRWVWWQEAMGAWSDHPLHGWGAGSFPVTHLLYRTNELPVRQPHNVPLQFLAETGLVGALLAMTALLALVAAALARIRSLPHGRERELGAALVAGGVAWLVHGVYDWDWDIPGVTMPALLLLGVAAGAPRPRLGTTPGWSLRRALGRAGESPVVRPALQGAVALLLCAFIVSAVLPAWSHSKALDALRLGDRPSPERLQDAAAQAQLASRLNPLAVEPLFSASTIAQRRGDALAARRYLLEAGHRQPDNRLVWFRLATLAVAMNDAPGFFRAANRALALDPASGVIRVLTQRAQGFITPPNESATATGTPLPSVAGPPSAPPAGG